MVRLESRPHNMRCSLIAVEHQGGDPLHLGQLCETGLPVNVDLAILSAWPRSCAIRSRSRTGPKEEGDREHEPAQLGRSRPGIGMESRLLERLGRQAQRLTYGSPSSRAVVVDQHTRPSTPCEDSARDFARQAHSAKPSPAR